MAARFPVSSEPPDSAGHPDCAGCPAVTTHLIIFGDSRRMSEIPDGSVHLTVTSPPYVTSRLRRGQRFPYAEYLEMIRSVFREVYRVTIPDGRFCLNAADIHSKYHYEDDDRFYRIPVGMDLLRIALEAGFRLLDIFIWDKGFNRNRGGSPGPFFGSYPYPATIYGNVYWEYVFVLVRPGPRRQVPREVREQSRIPMDTWKECVRRIWKLESETEWVKEHPAVFPPELPLRLIRLYSFVGDTVLDPFLGSGTTMLAARLLGRNSIGYEINRSYMDLIRRRTGMLTPDLFQPARFEIRIREDSVDGTGEEIPRPPGQPAPRRGKTGRDGFLPLFRAE